MYYPNFIVSNQKEESISIQIQTCRVAQSVMCLATDASLTADPGVAIRSRPVPYFRGDYEINSTVILLPSAESFKRYCCQLPANVYAHGTG